MPSPPENDPALEEQYLLTQIGAGDGDAFRLLYARYSRPLFSFAVRFLGDAHEAEEALQDGFVKIWHHAGSFDGTKARPFTWAVTIIRRVCIDRLRKRRRAPVMTPLPPELPAEPAAGGVDPVRRATETAENAARLQGALADIPAAQRQTLELALYSDLSHSEIAAQLDVPIGTVKSWIRRGLLGLRATLTDSVP